MTLTRRPPDWVCEDDAGDSSVFDDEDCDAPREIERDVDAILWDAIDGIVGPAFLAYPLALVVLTLLLHAGAWLAGADHGLFSTFAVAAWGMVPTLLLIPVSLGLLSTMLDPVTVSPGDDPRTAIRPLLAQIRTLEPYSVVLSAVAAVWGGVVWRFGLVHEQGLPGTEATVVAGLMALLTAAAGLV